MVCCLLCCLGDGFLWGGLQPRRQFQADIVSQSTSGLANGRFGKELMAKKKDVEGGVSKATAKGETDSMKAPPKASKAKSKAKPKTGADEVLGKGSEAMDMSATLLPEDLEALNAAFPLLDDPAGDAELDAALRNLDGAEFGIDDLFSGMFGTADGSGVDEGLDFGLDFSATKPKTKGTRGGRKGKMSFGDLMDDADVDGGTVAALAAAAAAAAGDDAVSEEEGALDPELLEAFAEFAAIEAAEAEGSPVVAVDAEGSPLSLGLDGLDGLDLDSTEFSVAAAKDPLEEFKRLLESLGPDSMFTDDLLFGMEEEVEIDEEMILAGKQMREFSYSDGVQVMVEMRDTVDGEREFRDGEMWNGHELPAGELTPRVDPLEEDPYYDVYAPNIYEGGKMQSALERFKVDPKTATVARDWNFYNYAQEPDEAIATRVRVISYVTNSTRNSTALEIVNKVYDYIKKGTEHAKDKIDFEIHCYKYDDDSEVC